MPHGTDGCQRRYGHGPRQSQHDAAQDADDTRQACHQRGLGAGAADGADHRHVGRGPAQHLG